MNQNSYSPLFRPAPRRTFLKKSSLAVAAGLAAPYIASNSFGQSNDIAATAFGLLPLLGTGETHKKKEGKYRANVQKALDYLIRKQARDGDFWNSIGRGPLCFCARQCGLTGHDQAPQCGSR